MSNEPVLTSVRDKQNKRPEGLVLTPKSRSVKPSGRFSGLSRTQVVLEMNFTQLRSKKQLRQTPLTRQTGKVLLTFGVLFKHVPPFNETIDENTGETLISIGRKLLSE